MPTRPLATVIAAIVEELTYSPPTPLDKLALLERVNAKLETQVNVKEVNKALYYMKGEGIVKNGAEMHGAMPTWLIVSAADRSAVVMPPAATPASAAGSGVPAVAAIAAVAMPPKRGRTAADEMAQEFRRHKSATEEAFAELVCPITFSLPIDPVTAEDGKVYERSAIEEWLKQQHKSPVTNLAMGTRLLPALQVKNMIRTMVTSGALTGDKVDAWMLKLEEEEKVAEWRRKAEAGDGRAMHILGFWHENGVNGLAKDLAKAFEWHEKSHEAGDATGTYCLSWYYLVGVGVPKCPMRGATLLMDAAGRGSQCACDTLGFACAIGCIGFPKDEKMARRYYSMVASASIDDYTAAKEKAATWLREHPAA